MKKSKIPVYIAIFIFSAFLTSLFFLIDSFNFLGAINEADNNTREEIPIYKDYYYDTAFKFIGVKNGETIECVLEVKVDSLTFDKEKIIVYSEKGGGYFCIDVETKKVKTLDRETSVEFNQYTLSEF